MVIDYSVKSYDGESKPEESQSEPGVVEARHGTSAQAHPQAAYQTAFAK